MAALQPLMSEQELRVHLRVDSKRQTRTWHRLRPYFAPAIVALPLTSNTQSGYRLYDTAKVRELLEARRHSHTGLARSRVLRKVG